MIPTALIVFATAPASVSLRDQYGEPEVTHTKNGLWKIVSPRKGVFVGSELEWLVIHEEADPELISDKKLLQELNAIVTIFGPNLFERQLTAH